MRINKLVINGFKNLRNFSIEFDRGSFTSVIVGQNGVGKSNILEALIIIFRDLDLGIHPAFSYIIEYTCRGHDVHINANPNSKNYVEIHVDGKKVTYKRFIEKGRDQYLPNYVFGYYSGPSNRMEMHFEKHQDQFYQDLINGIEKPLRPLLYARHVHSQFALLSFFYEQDKKILGFLRKYLRIEDFDSVLFIMREPPWKSKRGDARFWNSRGVVQQFLSKLYELSLSPLRIEQDIKIEFRKKPKRLEHLYLYLKDIDALRMIAGNYPSPQEFFKALESTYISKLISEVRIRVKVRNANGSLTFVELSEGEQQLLMVLGLLRFTKEDESLFLLDEPDTHLNPAWSMRYLEFLNEIVGDQDTSHIIMTTHDPLVIAALKKSQVRILRFDERKNLFFAEIPEFDPINMGYPEILTSDLFGLRSIISPEVLKLLDEKRSLAIKESLTEEERIRLSKLNLRLANFDFTKVIRDPLYEPFVRALTEIEKREGLQTPVLTKEQHEKRKQLAFKVLSNLNSTKDQVI